MWKQCDYCGNWFEPKHGGKKMCPECTQVIQRHKGRNLPRMYSGPTDVPSHERAVRERCIQRVKDTIVAEGYADRQRAKTLSMVTKIDTTL